MKRSFTLKSSKSKCLNGNLNVPSDKSISIRALILTSYCVGTSKIYNLLDSDDVLNTLEALKLIGIKIERKNNHHSVHGNGGLYKSPTQQLDLGNSGTGVRLLAGLLSTSKIDVNLVGDSSLSSRPMNRIINPLNKMNIQLKSNNGYLPIRILKDNQIFIPHKHILELGSAQVKSAILLASLNIKGETTILEKIPSRNHTEIMLEHLGARIKTKKNLISLKSPNCLSPNNITIPGDFSSAAFIIVAVLITKNSNVKILNVGLNFFRTGLLDILSKMGGAISISNKKTINNELVGDIEVRTSNLNCVKTTGKISPRMIDEFPILFVAASFAKGKSKFNGIGELKVKESNRLKVMHDVLKILGVDIKMGDDFIEIIGKEKYNNVKKIKTFRDHRIAMSVLVFGMASNGEITIDDMSMIKTSFPGFKEIFEKIGAQIKSI